MKIVAKMLAGFGAICGIVAVLGISMVWSLASLDRSADLVIGKRAPAVDSLGEIEIALGKALAALRGYMLTGLKTQTELRAEAWQRIGDEETKLDALITLVADADDQAKWAETKKILAELKAVQDKVEAMVGTPEALPATALLMGESAPMVDTMLKSLTAMIDQEQMLEATPERKALLITIVNARGRLTGAVADLRGFLATGDEKLKTEFQEKRQSAVAAMADLKTKTAYLIADQSEQFATLMKMQAEFGPISDQIIKIRSGNDWNVPLSILKNEALPRVARLDELIDGQQQADGTYAGGVSSNQKALMQSDTAKLNQLTDVMEYLAWALLAAGIVLGCVIAVVTARSIVKPLGMLNGVMRRLADRDLSVEVVGQARSDEIGEMAKTVQVFKDNMNETEQLRAEQEATKTRTEQERRKVMLDLADTFEASVGGVVTIVTAAAEELQKTAQAMSATAEETSRQSNAVAAASEQMSQNVQTVASATEELSASIGEISNQVTESTRIISAAVAQASDTNAKVKLLSEAAQKIGDVVTLINQIAGQTNLLALNATIEAARAGEAGKGFAVVASEVKNLATQTARATDEIAAQVRAIQDSTGSAAHAIDGIAQTVNRVSEISTAIAGAVEEQGAATQEIARNVQQASAGTTEVSSNIIGVTQASQQTSAGSTQVLAAASEMARNGERLKKEVGDFLNMIRNQ